MLPRISGLHGIPVISMYAVIACPSCNRLRVADCDTLTSDCPYCGKTAEHRHLNKLYEDRDQSSCRDAMAHLYGFVPEKKDKTKIEQADPHSTLAYRYEHASAVEEKIGILAEGLTDLYGTFTLENIEEIDPKNAKRLLAAMCEKCLVAEIRPGRYKA